MTTLLNFGRDVQGYNAYAPAPAYNKKAVLLTANVATSFTVPTNYQNWIIAFTYSPGSDVWVDFTGAPAVLPVAATFTDVTVEQLPASRKVQAGQSISVICSTANTRMGVLLYAIS